MSQRIDTSAIFSNQPALHPDEERNPPPIAIHERVFSEEISL